MKKEVLIAVVSGLILGLIITFGIWTANKSLEKQRLKNSASTQASPIPSSPLNSATKTLSLTSHEPNDLVNQSEVTLSGIAWPNAVIAVISENQDLFAQADEEGIFSVEIDLVKGFNEITLVATDDTNQTQTLNLVLTYSTTEFELEDQADQETQE